MFRLRIAAAAAFAVLMLAACGGGAQEPGASETSPTGVPPAEPMGTPLSKADIVAFAAAFGDNSLTGGQTAPRLYRWVNDRVAVFVQFDERDPAKATALRYIGISVKGVFCAENRPGGTKGGFPHFHRLDAAEYAQGHAGPPGTPGYWLSWVAVDEFTQRDGRQVNRASTTSFRRRLLPNGAARSCRRPTSPRRARRPYPSRTSRP
jgi:hypothetical protein